MKRIISILLIIFLCGCSAKKDNEIKEEKYVEPIKDGEVFEYLNEDTKALLYKANGGIDVETYVLKDLGMTLPDITLTDYYGNTFNLGDYKDEKLIIEISAYWCSHCKEQILKHNDDLLKEDNEIKIIQYFNEGDISGVESFYKDIGLSVKKDIKVVPYDEDFSKILSSFSLKYYPSFLFFNNGVLTFIKSSSLTLDEYNLLKDISFNNILDLNDLVDEEGRSIFSYLRNAADVIDDLDKDQFKILEELDNDGFTVDDTLKYIGTDFDFYNQLENDSRFISEVEFIDYTDKKLIVIYLYEPKSEAVSLINEFYRENKDVEVVILDVADEHTRKMAELLEPKVCSIMNQIPSILNDIDFYEYPSAVFVRKGVIVGIYSNILNKDEFKKAKELFLSDNSIALIKD